MVQYLFSEPVSKILEEDPVIAPGRIDWPQDEHVGRVPRSPPRVARRQGDVDNQRVAGIVGIDLSERAPGELLVLTHLAERQPIEVGDCVRVMTILVISASAGAVKPRMKAKRTGPIV